MTDQQVSSDEIKKPEHIPTPQTWDQVMMLLALGWNNKRIGNALGISSKDVDRHYVKGRVGLAKEQRDRVEAVLAERLWRQVEHGNVTAIKDFRALLDDGEEIPSVARPRAVARRREPKLGKKEQARVEARRPDTNTKLGQLMARRQDTPFN